MRTIGYAVGQPGRRNDESVLYSAAALPALWRFPAEIA